MPEPEQVRGHMENKSARISDVAAAAGVSVSTVSNVLNRPQLVNPITKEKVVEAIHQLDFVPNEHAAALRRQEGTPPSRATIVVPDPLSIPGSDALTTVEPPAVVGDSARAEDWATLRPGQVVTLVQGAIQLGTATVDAVTPDGTVLWVWMANGGGRTMLLSYEDIIVPADGTKAASTDS